MNLITGPLLLDPLKLTYQVEDDFDWYVSPHKWTSLAADSGSGVAIAAGDSGLLALTPGTTDNNECSVSLTNAVFKFTAGRSIVAEGLIQYSEANTSAVNLAFGLSSTFGANMLVDDGAGPVASFSGAIFYKVDGGTVWRVRSSIGTTNTDTVLTTTAGGTTAQRLRVEAKAVSLTRVEVTYFINGAPVLDPSAGYKKVLLHTLDATSAAAMKLGVYVKEGSTTAETVNVDYLGAAQTR